ncbi:MAG: hypothetical protein ACRBM6_34280, partial [Geminicoccales bacterium]
SLCICRTRCALRRAIPLTSAIERPVEWMILTRLGAAGERDQPLNIIRGKVRLPGSFVLSRRTLTTQPLPVADRWSVTLECE